MTQTKRREPRTQKRGAAVHPLEPLSNVEVEAAVAVVKSDPEDDRYQPFCNCGAE